MGMSSKPQIKPLLSGNVKRPYNMQLDIIKYEFCLRYVRPVQIKTDYQYADKVKTEFVINE